MLMTAPTTYALFRPTARAMRWGPFAVSGVLGLAILVIPELITIKLTAAHLTTLLRIAAACGALGVAFLLDDPAKRSTPTVPTPRLVRHAVRAALGLPVVGVWWAIAVTIAPVGAKHGVPAALPRGALTLEAAALVLGALMLAAIGQLFSSEGSSGIVATPVLLVLLAIVWFLPHRVALVVSTDDPQWTHAHHRWVGVLIAAGVGFGWASYVRDRRRS